MNGYQAPQQMNEKVVPQGGAPVSSQFGSKWAFGLFDCCSPSGICCLGFWCPCVLYGRTYQREHGNPDPSCCSWMCCGWYLAAQLGFHSCLQCMTRSQQRERYGIEGGSAGDFCAPLCCSCCAMIQEEKESLIRQTGIDPKTKVAYQPVGAGMQYSA